MTVETMAGTAAYLREHGYETEALALAWPPRAGPPSGA